MRQVYIVNGIAYSSWNTARKLSENSKKVKKLTVLEGKEFTSPEEAAKVYGASEWSIDKRKTTVTKYSGSKQVFTTEERVVITLQRNIGDFVAVAEGEVKSIGDLTIIKMDDDTLKVVS